MTKADKHPLKILTAIILTSQKPLLSLLCLAIFFSCRPSAANELFYLPCPLGEELGVFWCDSHIQRPQDIIYLFFIQKSFIRQFTDENHMELSSYNSLPIFFRKNTVEMIKKGIYNPKCGQPVMQRYNNFFYLPPDYLSISLSYREPTHPPTMNLPYVTAPPHIGFLRSNAMFICANRPNIFKQIANQAFRQLDQQIIPTKRQIKRRLEKHARVEGGYFDLSFRNLKAVLPDLDIKWVTSNGLNPPQGSLNLTRLLEVYAQKKVKQVIQTEIDILDSTLPQSPPLSDDEHGQQKPAARVHVLNAAGPQAPAKRPRTDSDERSEIADLTKMFPLP